MKQEILQKLEKIRNGEVPEGYKESKVGIIPKDWEKKDLFEIGTFFKGKGISINEIVKEGMCGIRYGEIYSTYDLVVEKCVSHINLESAKNSKKVKRGDLLFAGSGETAEDIGKCILLDTLKDTYAGGDTIVFRKTENCSQFLVLALNSEYVISQKRKLGQGQSIVHIYPDQLSKIKIILPKNEEQKEISKILFNLRKIISKKNELIKNLVELKKGFVQKLVNPLLKEKNNMGTLSKCLTSTSYPVDKPSKPYDSLGIRSHCKGTMIKQIKEPNKVAMKILYKVKENELIVNITFAWEGAIALLSKKDEGKLVSHRFPTFKFNEEFAIPDYFKHLIKTKWFVFQLSLVSPGGAGRNRVLSKKDFLKIKLALPPVEKQRQIANFLNSLDDQIDLLKKEINNLKEQKRGLMQLLLTGIVRVNVKDNKNVS